uniref:Uncharacterized protein n=1 Tax=Arundo donax TaxID=35708 RepID=A0A0A9GGQ2_ARUDO
MAQGEIMFRFLKVHRPRFVIVCCPCFVHQLHVARLDTGIFSFNSAPTIIEVCNFLVNLLPVGFQLLWCPSPIFWGAAVVHLRDFTPVHLILLGII